MPSPGRHLLSCLDFSSILGFQGPADQPPRDALVILAILARSERAYPRTMCDVALWGTVRLQAWYEGLGEHEALRVPNFKSIFRSSWSVFQRKLFVCVIVDPCVLVAEGGSRQGRHDQR